MSHEEEQLYIQIKSMKKERDYLYVIFEELDELIKNGYNGPLAEEAARGLLYSYEEYKKWRNDEVRRR